jgi:hypothetical protein
MGDNCGFGIADCGIKKGARPRAQGARHKDVISYKLYVKDCTEYFGSSIKSTHPPKDSEQLITYN